MKKIRPAYLRKKYHGFLKLCSVSLSLILLYQGLQLTVPLFSKGLNALTTISAGMSFINGGVAFAQREISEYQAEDDVNFTSHAQQEDLLSDTLSSTEITSSQPTDTSQTESVVETNLVAEELPAPPERPENAGDVTDKVLTPGSSSQFVALDSGYVKNLSALTASQVVEYSKAALPITLEDTQQPQVLIYHTHATESYQPYDCDWYDVNYNARNTDNSQNMVAVGDVLTQILQEAGIGVIHDTTQHDNPSYTGAYDRSRVTIQNYLQQYPSIKVILDVHRDALQGDNLITAPTTEIEGIKTAQLMMICCADDGSGRLPNYTQNLTFATALQQRMETDYPTLTRPILLDDRFYNQDLSPASILVEVGGHGNTLPEAKNAIRLFGNTLIKVLKGQ